jgi:hypothetical protein
VRESTQPFLGPTAHVPDGPRIEAGPRAQQHDRPHVGQTRKRRVCRAAASTSTSSTMFAEPIADDELGESVRRPTFFSVSTFVCTPSALTCLVIHVAAAVRSASAFPRMRKRGGQDPRSRPHACPRGWSRWERYWWPEALSSLTRGLSAAQTGDVAAVQQAERRMPRCASGGGLPMGRPSPPTSRSIAPS